MISQKISDVRLAQDESGSSLIEFALSLSILLAVLFGIMEFSLALYAQHYVANAARDATRYAMVRGSSWSSTPCASTSSLNCMASNSDITNYVKSTAPGGLTVSKIIVTTSWPGASPSGSTCDTTDGANSPNCMVRVTVSYAFNFMLPFLPQDAMVFTSTSAVAIAQ